MSTCSSACSKASHRRRAARYPAHPPQIPGLFGQYFSPGSLQHAYVLSKYSRVAVRGCARQVFLLPRRSEPLIGTIRKVARGSRSISKTLADRPLFLWVKKTPLCTLVPAREVVDTAALLETSGVFSLSVSSSSDVTISTPTPLDSYSSSHDSVKPPNKLAFWFLPRSLPSPSAEGVDLAVGGGERGTWTQITFLVMITFPVRINTRLLSLG